MAICKWCGEENPDGVNVCSFCGQDMSIFEDSGLLKNVSQPAQAEAARPRATAGAATAAPPSADASRIASGRSTNMATPPLEAAPQVRVRTFTLGPVPFAPTH